MGGSFLLGRPESPACRCMAGISGLFRGGPRSPSDQGVARCAGHGRGLCKVGPQLATWRCEVRGTARRRRFGVALVCRGARGRSSSVSTASAPRRRRAVPSRPTPGGLIGTGPDGTTRSPSPSMSPRMALRRRDTPRRVPALPAGQPYLYVWPCTPNYEFAGMPSFRSPMPPTDATLVTAGGTVAGQSTRPSSASTPSWYFPVADSMTTATLARSRPSPILGNDAATSSPGPSARVRSPSWPRCPCRPVPQLRPADQRTDRSPDPEPTSRYAHGGSGSSSATVGVGVGGLAVLGAGGAGLVSLVRRRAFYRADREGRVVLVRSTALRRPRRRPAQDGAGRPFPGRHGILVKLLGWLELEGTKRPVTAGPLLELIVYLVLNPGRSFTSVQLRESIWGLGRQPITSGHLPQVHGRPPEGLRARRGGHRSLPLRDDRAP